MIIENRKALVNEKLPQVKEIPHGRGATED